MNATIAFLILFVWCAALTISQIVERLERKG